MDSTADPGRRLLESIPAAGQVIDEIAIGVAETAPDGSVAHANPVARTLLDGPLGGAIRDMLREMTVRVVADGGHLEAQVRGPAGEVRLLLARSAGEGCIAFLERDTERAHRTQVKILRSMLASVCEGSSAASAGASALVSLAWALPGAELVLYEVDPGAGALVALAQARVPPSRAAGLAALPLDGDSPAARAVRSGAPSRSLTQAMSGPAEAAIALPVKGGSEILGALHAAGSPALLGESELRMLGAMADAAGSLLGRQRQEESLARERRTRQQLEARGERARRVEVQREGLATVGRLTACIAHEMNGPLAFMRTNLKVLGQHADLLAQVAGPAAGPDLAEIAGDSAEIVEECLEGLDRIGSILQSLRGLVRDPAERVRFDPSHPVREAVEVFRRARRGHCDVALAVAADVPELEGSPAVLSHVVLNLLENGLEAMGGTGALQVRALRAGTSLRLEVEDGGPGIPSDVRGHLFEPYFSTKPVGKGTGLGLFVCRELVSRMGGRIGFQSGDGGTVFHVELPGAA